MEKNDKLILSCVDNFLNNSSRFLEENQRPLVTLSYAQSIDGSISPAKGKKLSISGKKTKILTHQLRAMHEGILVGIETVLADDPQLNVRLVPGKNPQPVVLDSKFRFPKNARMLKNSFPPWIFTGDNIAINVEKQRYVSALGARVIHCKTNKYNQIDIHQMLKKIGEFGVNNLMVEGGATVISSFLREMVVDQVLITIAPVLIGGYKAVLDLQCDYPLNDDKISALSSYPRCNDFRFINLGNDLVFWGKVVYGNQP